MQPRNLTLYRLSAELCANLERMADALGDHRLRSVGPMELQTKGFVPPIGRGDDAPLTHTVGKCIWFTLGTEEKLLPASVLNDELRRKIEEISEEEGRRVGGRERKRLKEDLLTQLLPRAFVRSSRLSAYVDLQAGWMVIDTATRKKAEMLISAVREALGSFPVTPLAPEEGPRVLLTDWLASGSLPTAFTLGDECELRDPATSTGAIAVARRQDLDAEEVKEHLRNGKQVFKLGLSFDDRMTFVLCEDLVVRKLRFMDVVLDELDDSSEDAASEADAQFALFSLELRSFLARLETLFGLQIDAPLHLHPQDAPASMRDATAAARRLDSMCRADGVNATLETRDGSVLATFGESGDALYAQAVELVRSTGKASISTIQRHLRIGYNRAARLIEQMERDRIVSVPAVNGSRTVFNTPASPAKESP